MIKPYTWQESTVKRSVEILTAGDVCINTSDTGTGKTICALETLKRMSLRGLVIAPKTVHTAWRNTASNMQVELRDVINIERLQYKNPYYQHGTWHLDEIDAVVVDEVHKGCSGPKSKTTKIIGSLKAYPVKVMPMSATIADSPLKLRAVGFMAGLHGFNNSSFYTWCLKHGCYRKPMIKGLHFPRGKSGVKHLKKLHEDMQDCMVRIKISEVPDFPETVIQSQLYDLEAKYTDQINQIYNEMEMALKVPGANELTEILRARQKTELYKIPLLSELVLETVEEDCAPVVFLCFRESLDKLAAELKKLGVTYQEIRGGQTKKGERDRAIEDFDQDKVQAMLCTIAAGGTGTNLHAIPGRRPRRSFITPNYCAYEFKQALGRIHRATGTNTIQKIVLAAGTIEERVHKSVSQKLKNISLINDGDLI